MRDGSAAPVIRRSNDADLDGDGQGDACDAADDDGRPDTSYACEGTAAGAVVDPSTGCARRSGSDLCTKFALSYAVARSTP